MLPEPAFRACPWCDTGEALKRGRLCSACRNAASGLGRLSQAELDSLPFGVMSVDLQGNILAVNRPEQEFAQKALNHSLGKNFFTEIAPCSQVRGFKGRFEAFVRSERAVHGFRFVYRFPKGNIGVVIEFVRASHGIIVIARRTV